MNNISGNIPDDFLQTVFITLPKVNQAQDCCDFRTISSISHASKVLLHLINARITPIIERHLSSSQTAFRKGRGTTEAIFKLRTMTERSLHVNKKQSNGIPERKRYDRSNIQAENDDRTITAC